MGMTVDFALGIAEEDGIVDDGRRWWYIGAVIWPTLHLYPGPNGRTALAAFRRAIIDAEIAKGESRRSAVAFVQAAGLHVDCGPLTTPQAYEHEVGWAWAWASCHFSTDVPNTPATAEQALPFDLDKAARIRADVRRIFLQRKAPR